MNALSQSPSQLDRPFFDKKIGGIALVSVVLVHGMVAVGLANMRLPEVKPLEITPPLEATFTKIEPQAAVEIKYEETKKVEIQPKPETKPLEKPIESKVELVEPQKSAPTADHKNYTTPPQKNTRIIKNLENSHNIFDKNYKTTTSSQETENKQDLENKNKQDLENKNTPITFSSGEGKAHMKNQPNLFCKADDIKSSISISYKVDKKGNGYNRLIA